MKKILTTKIDKELHEKIKQSLLSINEKNKSFDIFGEGVESHELSWIVQDFEKFLFNEYQIKVKSYFLDCIIHTGEETPIDWHTDASDEDYQRLMKVPEEKIKEKVLVYYPKTHDSFLEIDDGKENVKIKVEESTAVIFNTNLNHRVVINDGKNTRISLNYIFTII